MNINWKDIGIRAGKTFLQSFLAVMSVGITGVMTVEGLGNLAFAGLIAGLSAAFSFLQNFLKETA